MTDADLIAEQCINQQATTPLEVAQFGVAYMEGRIAVEHFNAMPSEALFQHLHSTLAPEHAGYRDMPVLMRGKIGVAAEHIPRLMKQLMGVWHELEPDMVHHELLRIHPFTDGNGRIAHIIWAMARTLADGGWPMRMPPRWEWD